MNWKLICVLLVHRHLRLKKLKLLLMLLLQKRRDQIRTRNYITSESLGGQAEWYYFYANASDETLLNSISLTRESFEKLLRRFREYYVFGCGPGKKGRHARLEDHAIVLGLILTYYCDSMSLKTLCRMFRVPLTTISRTLRKV